jgi:hypothetical protein
MAKTFKAWKIGRCGRKVRHSTFAIAMKVLAERVAKLNDPCLAVYACDLCDGFHLGHKPTVFPSPRLETAQDLAKLNQKILKTRIRLLNTQVQMITMDLQPNTKPKTRARFEHYVSYLEQDLQRLLAVTPRGTKPQIQIEPPHQLSLFEN